MENQLITSADAAILTDGKYGTSDYLVAAACGAVAGLVDIFLVGTPGDSAGAS